MVRSLALCVVMTLLTTTAASAGVISGSEDSSQFGSLDQHKLSVCKTPGGVSEACGPAAAVNSFVFLEHKYPKVYDDSLVDLSGLGGPDFGEVLTGNDLGSDTFMGCGCGGTTWDDFYRGKKAYIDLMDPGSTTYGQQQDPGAANLARALNVGADVEIYLQFGSKAHFVTLTSITYDTVLQDGTISYIDPLDGKSHTAGIFGNGASPGLGVNYTSPDGSFSDTGAISFGALEIPTSSTPEPATWALLMIGFGVTGAAARRARRVRELAAV